MNIAIFIAVRLKSKRLKRKALAKIGGIELILHLTKRLKNSKRVKKIVWCTSKSNEDKILCELANKNKVDFFRGDEKNIILRFIKAAEKVIVSE